MNTTRKIAVVTGGAGFIGGNLAHALVKAGWETRTIDKNPTFRRSILSNEATLHEVDIRSTDVIRKIMEGADTVFHTAPPRERKCVESSTQALARPMVIKIYCLLLRI